MPKAEEYKRQETTINGVAVVVSLYRLGETYHCSVANKDPGAVICRTEGQSPDEAQERAFEKCRARL